MFPKFDEFINYLDKNCDGVFDISNLQIYEVSDFTPENAQQLYAATVKELAHFCADSMFSLLHAYHAFLEEHSS